MMKGRKEGRKKAVVEKERSSVESDDMMECDRDDEVCMNCKCKEEDSLPSLCASKIKSKKVHLK